jgi:hypothetical protein
VQIQPRHQDKAKGSSIAPLPILASTTYSKKNLAATPGKATRTEDSYGNGFDGIEYEIEKTMAAPAAPIR